MVGGDDPQMQRALAESLKASQTQSGENQAETPKTEG